MTHLERRDSAMPADDPTAELVQLLDLGELNVVPLSAIKWAESALTQSDSILATVESMLDNGVDAPTEKQKRALRNIHDAALSWLPAQHVIDSFASELAAVRGPRSKQEDASGQRPRSGSRYTQTDDDPPIKRPPPPPRVTAIESVLSSAQRLGVISEHPTYKLPSREDKPFRLVRKRQVHGEPADLKPDPDPGPALYHHGDCPVLATEIQHAKSCTDDKARIGLYTLEQAKHRGIACPVCLFGLAKARTDHLRLKPCRVQGPEAMDNGLLLRWRQDTTGKWKGLVLRQAEDSVFCEVVASSDLESIPE
ncbi:hypothetical protein [Rhodococcus sp. P14]|uniref:hypothetical protein n=1 Tax=Rhodococcus sp. P14 TaxID=450821 RepID=UPI0012F6F4EC|nr:hypothetical protein [Rhodococcus sp. P14]